MRKRGTNLDIAYNSSGVLGFLGKLQSSYLICINQQQDLQGLSIVPV